MRKYIVVQFNVRHPDGRPMNDAENHVIEDGLEHKGANWWHDGGNHKPGTDPCYELEFDVEGEDSKHGRPCLFDQMAFSYDVEPMTLPFSFDDEKEAEAEEGWESYEMREDIGDNVVKTSVVRMRRVK